MALIAAELASGREVKVPEDGSLETVDDLGFVLGFQVTVICRQRLPFFHI